MKVLQITILTVLLIPAMIFGATKVVTSTSDLAYFAKVIGGDSVTVESIASPKSDLHYVETRPSFMVKVRDADIAFKIGLELDVWMDRIIDGSRNSHIKIVDCSKYVKPLEVPGFNADASYGDLHRFGNPHYWISPANIEPLTQSILEGLIAVSPGGRAYFENNRTQFLALLGKDIEAIKANAAILDGAEIITYHNSWPYFAEYFGIKLAGFVEKYPGVAPSPSHISETIDLVKSHGIKVIAIEPYFERRVPEKIAEASGARVVILYPSIGGRKDGESYTDWLRGNAEALVEALK